MKNLIWRRRSVQQSCFNILAVFSIAACWVVFLYKYLDTPEKKVNGVISPAKMQNQRWEEHEILPMINEPENQREIQEQQLKEKLEQDRFFPCTGNIISVKNVSGVFGGLDLETMGTKDRIHDEEVTLKPGQTELERGGYVLKPTETANSHNLDPYLCKSLENLLFKNKSVVDLGCGVGLYGICFLRLRSYRLPNAPADFFTKHLRGLKDWWDSTKPQIQSWTGFDGIPGIHKLTGGLVRQMDLSKPGYIGQRFDWVMSMEVGEHIPREYEENYIGNLIRHAKEGIVLSWAIEGQSGRRHVNLRNNDVIIAIMEAHGFLPHPEIWHQLRANAFLGWFKNTIMVFTPKGQKPRVLTDDI